jgi:protein TonB
MTNNEILKASLLDIIFENRNKEYGAYALRNDYDKRLVKALTVGLCLVLLLILFNYLNLPGSSMADTRNYKDGSKIIKVVIEPEKQPEPEKPKEVEKPKPAQIDFQTLKIVVDNKVTDPPPDNSDVDDKIISDVNTPGTEDDKPKVADLTGDNDGKSGGDSKPAEPEKEIKIYQREPQFPGGYEALAAFMRNNLVTPEELEIGEKKIVKIKFIVGKDGSITDITILESPGKNYDKEVSRVVKRMPKWEPAIQNDINVAVGYILPVTFMGVEE